MNKIAGRIILLGVVLTLALSMGASAGSVNATVTPSSIGLQETDWISTLSVSKFDVSLGTLTSVVITLYGNVNDTIRFENMAASASTVNAGINTAFSLSGPSPIVTLSMSIAISKSNTVTAYDGTLDWGGPPPYSGNQFNGSGREYVDLVDSNSTSSTFNTNLSMFQGIGTYNLTAGATANSFATGSGNLVTWFTSRAGASATVVYNYREVPEPASLLALSSGLIGLIGFCVRKKH